MILTKDNLLRFIREKKYVTPAIISEVFETTTMIASTALSELAKAKQIEITHLKLSSTPYYYDPRQSECLIELGEKHLTNYDKEVFLMLKENQVLNDSSLSIQQRLAVERIKDFAIPLEISHSSRNLKFWVWYLRNINETKKQIVEVLSGKSGGDAKSKKISQTRRTDYETKVSEISQMPKTRTQEKPFVDLLETSNGKIEEESKNEMYIENYLKKNYLRIENKNKNERFIRYTTSLTVNRMKVVFDCIYYLKKPNETQILKFYTSSNKPKIVFIENAQKKLFKLAQNLDNLEIVNI